MTNVDIFARCSPLNRLNVSAWPTGINRPPPIPWTKRQITSSLKLLASPHIHTEAVNTIIETVRISRLPQRPANQVLTGMISVSPRI
ncbi:hypothetical protein D9M71_785260 [compost metagenome]